MDQYILGLSCYYHNSAAALLKNGEIVAAAQEERFSRKKHDSRFPNNAVSYFLKSQGINLSDVQEVVYYEKPLLAFERLLETYLGAAPRVGWHLDTLSDGLTVISSWVLYSSLFFNPSLTLCVQPDMNHWEDGEKGRQLTEKTAKTTAQTSLASCEPWKHFLISLKTSGTSWKSAKNIGWHLWF